MNTPKTFIHIILMTLLLCTLCIHVCAAAVKVDSLSIEYTPHNQLGKLTHCFILKDSTLQIHTKHTNLPIKEVTDQCVVDSFITYARLFYIDQTAMYGEETMELDEDFPDLNVKGYMNHKLVVGHTYFIFNAKYKFEYIRFVILIERLSEEYDRSLDEAINHIDYAKNINKYDRLGRKIGKWITKYRHSVVEANYKSGKLHGLVKRYSYTGGLQQIRHYKMGILIGPAYSFSGRGDMAIYKNIKKSEVSQAYFTRKRQNRPVNYTADEVNYYTFGWSTQNNYYNDLPDYMYFATHRCDSLPTFNSYYNRPSDRRSVRRYNEWPTWMNNWFYTHKYYTHK